MSCLNLIQRRVLILGTLRPSICRYSSSSGDDNGKKGLNKLEEQLKKDKDQKLHQKPIKPGVELFKKDKDRKLHQKPIKPVELAKPSRKNMPETKKSQSSSSSSSDEDLDEDLVKATKKVAAATANQMKGGTDDERYAAKIKTENDLYRKLGSLKKETEDSRKASQVSGQKDLQAVFGGDTPIKIVKESKSLIGEELLPMSKKLGKIPNEFPTNSQRKPGGVIDEDFLRKRREMRRQDREKKPQMIENYTPIELFQGTNRLGIFSSDAPPPQDHYSLRAWQAMSDREMKILTSLGPKNLIEDMIAMTDKGTLWHFPIDNEQGIVQEELEPFIDHVFLERHLEPWCPPEGPVRDFMELITIVLSKNAFMTAAKKKEYIDWFRNYLEQPEQKEILKISGAFDD